MGSLQHISFYLMLLVNLRLREVSEVFDVRVRFVFKILSGKSHLIHLEIDSLLFSYLENICHCNSEYVIWIICYQINVVLFDHKTNHCITLAFY